MLTRVFGIVTFFGLMHWEPSAHAYALVVPPGQSVSLKDETAIIIWDEPRKIEHFIRRATFQSSANDFGFLVPTPTVPEISVVEPGLFDRIEAFVREQTSKYMVMQRALRLRGALGGLSDGGGAVVVISQKRVGAYETAILKSADEFELENWLEKNNYQRPAKFKEWVRPYLKEKWVITAFRFAGDKSKTTLGVQAVDMAFRTPRPFYPYREPSAPRVEIEPANRRLNIYFIGSAAARITNEHLPQVRRWAQGWSLNPDFSIPAPIAQPLWLSTFYDESSVRVDQDLFFSTAAERGGSPRFRLFLWLAELVGRQP